MKTGRALQKSQRFTCRRKRRYGNEDQVSMAAASLTPERGFYKCSACAGWHLTHRSWQ